MAVDTLVEKSHQYLWHPCSQMKDYESFKPIAIQKAKGAYFQLTNGKYVIDAISSWWCKSLGHNHPRLKQALIKQLDDFEHVILVNTTNELIVNLSEKLTKLTKNLHKAFYANEGSSAVEIALKMSLHARQILGQSQRQKYMSLANGYHGETNLALSVSDLGLYRKPYENILIDCIYLKHIPYVSSKEDPIWQDCSAYWPVIENQLNQHAETLTAIIIEPIVQGAGGMLIYSKDFLCRLRKWTAENNIHLIADEIMTGIGRTGLPLACQHAGIEPDFLCLGKGLTAGWLPLSAVLTSNSIYQLFYNDYEKEKNFLHSHTFSGNALAASVALECLTIMEQENIYENVINNEHYMKDLMLEIAESTGKLKNIRNIGAIVAADLIVDDPKHRAGYAIYQQAVQLGAFLRPLGNTLYWLPPLNTERSVLKELQAITGKAIKITI